jgi:hypothetical protein
MDAENNRGGVLSACAVPWCASTARGDFCAIHAAKPVMRGEDRETWEKRLRAEARRQKQAALKAASDAAAAKHRPAGRR